MNTLTLSRNAVGNLRKQIPQSFPSSIPISYMAIPDIAEQAQKKYLLFSDIITILLNHDPSLTTNKIFSPNRQRESVTARYIIFYFLRNRKYSKYITSEIGAHFHKNHATVIHGSQTIASLMSIDRKFAADIQSIEDQIINLLNK